MARIPDLLIDARVRQIVADGFRALRDNMGRELPAIAALFGVQPKTLEGWTQGRGSPLPKATEGQFLISGNLQEEWLDRAICGLALSNSIIQTGLTGIRSEYQDSIGEAPLADILARVRDYLTRDTGDPWIDGVWRRLRIESWGGGLYTLIVTYAAGISNQETGEL